VLRASTSAGVFSVRDNLPADLHAQIITPGFPGLYAVVVSYHTSPLQATTTVISLSRHQMSPQ
jgi:hypothetical protein